MPNCARRGGGWPRSRRRPVGPVPGGRGCHGGSAGRGRRIASARSGGRRMRGCRGVRRRVVASTRPSPRWRPPGPGGRRTAAPPRGRRGRSRRGPSCRVAPARRRVVPRGWRRVRSDPAASPTRATGSPSSRARSIKTCGSRSARCAATVDHTAGVDAGTVSSSSQAGTISRSSSRGSDTAKKPSAQRSSRQLPPQLVAPTSPQAHGRGPFAQQRECVQFRERPGEPIDPFHQALRRSERLVGPSGERHGPAVRPALHPGVVHVGRVTSRDPRTSERRSIARRTAQRDPS